VFRVSIQQAAQNAIAKYLQGVLVDCIVDPQWPVPDKRLQDRLVTVIPGGARQDEPLDIKELSRTNVSDQVARSVYRVAACYQPLQLDVWCTSQVSRDDILAQLDDVLFSGAIPLGAYNPDPVAHGNLVTLEDGWEETIADFSFENPDLDDDTEPVLRDEFRATFRGGAYFMLTVTRENARQKLLEFRQTLGSNDTRITEIT